MPLNRCDWSRAPSNALPATSKLGYLLAQRSNFQTGHGDVMDDRPAAIMLRKDEALRVGPDKGAFRISADLVPLILQSVRDRIRIELMMSIDPGTDTPAGCHSHRMISQTSFTRQIMLPGHRSARSCFNPRLVSCLLSCL